MNWMRQLIALAGVAVVGAQLVLVAMGGQGLCQTAGCRLVDRLTTIAPLYFNIAGLLFVITVWWGFRGSHKSADRPRPWLLVLLLAAMAAEAVLLGFQLFTARSLCLYCLIVFLLVLLLNLMAGWRHLLSSLATVAAVLATFSTLSFISPALLTNGYTLADGTYGSLRCDSPAKQLYLIFSPDCRHCDTVMAALANCNSCDFHLNPTAPVEGLNLEGILLSDGYKTEVNRLTLSLLGIDEVPVLLARSGQNWTLVKGDRNIINYITQACFESQPTLYLDRSLHPDQSEMSVITDPSSGCSLQVDCDTLAQPPAD